MKYVFLVYVIILIEITQMLNLLPCALSVPSLLQMFVPLEGTRCVCIHNRQNEIRL